MSIKRTSSGRPIDFDLIRAKQQLDNNPAPLVVRQRQVEIDRRLRKRIEELDRKKVELDRNNQNTYEEVMLGEAHKEPENAPVEETATPKTAKTRKSRQRNSTVESTETNGDDNEEVPDHTAGE